MVSFEKQKAPKVGIKKKKKKLGSEINRNQISFTFLSGKLIRLKYTIKNKNNLSD